MIKLIIFDANKVIYNVSNMLSYFYAEQEKFLRKHNILDLNKARKTWENLGKDAMLGKMSMDDAHKKYLLRLGLSEDLLEEYQKFDKEAFSKAEVMENSIKKVLIALRKEGYKLAILSDSGRTSEQMKEMFGYINLAESFDKIFVSSEIGYKKPEKAAYEAVLKSFKVRPEEAVFIGHDDDELKGAKELKIKTVSYNGDPCADFTIKSFLELPDLIKKMEHASHD